MCLLGIWGTDSKLSPISVGKAGSSEMLTSASLVEMSELVLFPLSLSQSFLKSCAGISLLHSIDFPEKKRVVRMFVFQYAKVVFKRNIVTQK